MVSGRRLAGMAATGALGACCLAAVGCSGGSGAGSGPLANMTGAAVVAKAVADLKVAPSVKVNSASIVQGLYITSYQEIVAGKGCTGTIMQGELGEAGTLTYTTIGQTVYFKPDSNMWQLMAGANAAKTIQAVNGRYVQDPVSALGGLGSCVISSPQPGTVTKGQLTTINGIQVLPLKDSQGGVMYVTDTSTPEVVQDDAAPATGTTDPSSESTFTFGASVKLTPPPASQVISGSKLNF